MSGRLNAEWEKLEICISANLVTWFYRPEHHQIEKSPKKNPQHINPTEKARCSRIMREINK